MLRSAVFVSAAFTSSAVTVSQGRLNSRLVVRDAYIAVLRNVDVF